MRLRKLVLAAVGLVALATMVGKAEAAVLTINDGADVWTLTVGDNCTTCAVQLKVVYNVGSSRAVNGNLLDAVQWEIGQPNLTITSIGFQGTTGSTIANTAANWSFAAGSLNANGCTGGNTSAACGDYAGGGLTGIAPGVTLIWNFNTTFSGVMNAATGNLRATYNNANGRNGGPGTGQSAGGGNFGTSGTSGSLNVPEPASLLLLGAGLAIAAWRLRRAQ